MAAQKPVQLVNGVLTEVTAVDASTGASDAGKIVALNSSGLLDTSMMPAGLGVDINVFPATENLAAGDFVNIYNSSGTMSCRKADANGKPVHGFVTASVTSGQNASVIRRGTNSQLSGLTLGASYYLSGSTPGAITTTVPTTSGHLVQFIGVAHSATALSFDFSNYVQRG